MADEAMKARRGGPLVRLAGTLGSAVGTFQRSRLTAFHGNKRRPAFFHAMAQDARYGIGETASSYHAQRRAIQNSWVFTAIGFIAREVSAARFGVVKYKGYDEEPEAVPNHPLEALLRRPNPWMGRAFLWQYTTWWIQLNGNGYWFLSPGEDGRLAEVWPLPAEDVMPVPGEKEGDDLITHYDYTVGGTRYEIPSRLIVHMRLPNPFSIFSGLSPLVAALLPTDQDQAMSRWNASFFGRDNVMPSAIINLSSGDPSQPVEGSDVEALKDDLKSEYSAFHRKTAVTSAYQLQVELLGWSPKDLDFVTGRQFTKEEIYEIYGVPPGMLDKNATYSNSENAEIVFTNKTLWPLLSLLAEQITAELVQPAYGEQFEAQFDDVRKTNRERELSEVSASGPYLTIDEVRRTYWQLKPLPDGRGEWTVNEQQSAGTEVGGYLEEGGNGRGGAPLLGPGDREEQGPALLGPGEGEPGEAEYQLTQDELRRWRTKAVNAAKRGRPLPVDFRSDVLPDSVMEEVAGQLAYVDELRSEISPSSVLAEVKAAFEGVCPYPFGLRHRRGDWPGPGRGGRGRYIGRSLTR